MGKGFFFLLHNDMPLTNHSDLLTQEGNVNLCPLYLIQACSAWICETANV